MPISKTSFDKCMSDVKKEFPKGRSKKKKISKKAVNKQRYAICKNRVDEVDQYLEEFKQFIDKF